MVQLSHPYTTTGKTIALTRQPFVGKVMSLLFNMLSRLVITFLPRSKCLLISWLQWETNLITYTQEIQLNKIIKTVRQNGVYMSFWTKEKGAGSGASKGKKANTGR